MIAESWESRAWAVCFGSEGMRWALIVGLELVLIVALVGMQFVEGCLVVAEVRVP